MARRGALRLLLAAGLLGLPALAAASPPDPLWVAGLYDDGDHDDVVGAVLALAGIEDTAAPRAAPEDRVVGHVRPALPAAPCPVPHSAPASRAPPPV